MDRQKLIALAIKYNGEYNQIVDAIKSEEEVPFSDSHRLLSKNAITIFDKEYPKQLLELKYPPFVLFYKGNIELLKEKNIEAVIGSRMPTQYALDATEALVNRKFNRENTVVISGLAKGIDAKAHETANKTIAVIGCGIDYIYPSCNFDLFNKIEKEGLIISEYPHLTKPLGYHFPFRNRIIAALANNVNVMQCTSKSGTMTAIDEALELGKNVKVLPFDVFTLDNNGKKPYNNVLINEGCQVITI